ncbi:V-set and immunoglobulin domain-containing protein 10 [Neosynchiropus ocellatus]
MKLLALLHACFCAAVAASPDGDSEVSAEPGDVVLLPCYSAGSAAPSLTSWTGPGLGAAGGLRSSDPPGERISVLRDGSLSITWVSAADEGVYFCNSSLAGNVTFHGRVLLHVTPGLRNVSVSVTPPSALLNGTFVTTRGSSVTFNCSGSWAHSHRLTWRFRGSRSDDQLLSNSSSPWLAFTIAAVQAGDQGVYTCSCRSAASRRTVESGAELLVYYAPDRHPECTWAPALDSSHVQFNCSWFGAYPAPTLQWEDGRGVLASAEADSLSVTLNRSQLASGQTVRCSAHHAAAEREASCSFTLKLPYPSGDPLSTAVEGTNVTLTCTESTSTPPASTTWRRGLQREEVLPGAKYILSLEGPALRLTIVNLTKDDEGVYFCRSENPLGFQEQEVYLTVKKSSAVTGAVIGVFIAALIVGVAVVVAKTAYASRHRICLGAGFGQMDDHGDVLSLVESDEDELFQDSVPRLPPLANGSSTTLVQIHRIPSSDHEEAAATSPRQPEDTAVTEEPADLVTL